MLKVVVRNLYIHMGTIMKFKSIREFDNEFKLTRSNSYDGDWYIIESFKGKEIYKTRVTPADSIRSSAKCYFEVIELKYQPLIKIAPKEKEIESPVKDNAKFQNVNIVVPEVVKVIESSEQNVLPTLDDVRFKLGACATKQ